MKQPADPRGFLPFYIRPVCWLHRAFAEDPPFAPSGGPIKGRRRVRERPCGLRTT